MTANTMPPVIQRYIDANNASDWAKLAACFSMRAVVRDEGEVHTGRGAIGMWARDTMQKYEMAITPLSLREGATTFELLAEVEGNFPASPTELTFKFQLKGSEIISLRIA